MKGQAEGAERKGESSCRCAVREMVSDAPVPDSSFVVACCFVDCAVLAMMSGPRRGRREEKKGKRTDESEE